MRSVLIVAAGVVLLLGGFFLYYALQSPGAGRRAASPRPATTLPVSMPDVSSDPQQVAGPGTDVWIQTFDEKTNRVAFQFRASRYDPQPQGPVDVANPQAELFTGGEPRQVIRIEGRSGRVVMPSTPAQRGQLRGNEAAAPRRGELHDVTISLFDETDLSRPLLVCTVNNIAFDNDTYRIATEAYHDGMREVSEDEVPIQVRGEDFDFDGRGLTIRWNEADRRLQLLEIAHGDRLVIKSPELLRAFDRTSGAAARPRGTDRAPAANASDDARIVLASAPPEPAPAPAAATAPSTVPPVYRASFRDAVRITRGDALLASADQMLVDFISDEQEPVSTPGSARRRSTAAAAREEQSPPATAPVPAPGAAPPATPLEPVLVRWTGKLRVTALEDAPRPAPGSLNIAMSSEAQPVVLHHRGLDVRCASFDYRSGDDSLSITSSKAIPSILLKLADGTTVQTPSLVYTGNDSSAVLRGPSRARIPLPAEAGRGPQQLDAAWDKSCVLTLSGTAAGTEGVQELRPQRALFEGEVQVDHPQLGLKCQTLELGFDPSADGEQPAPRDVKATGSVECRLIDSSGNHQNIRCDELTATVAAAEPGAGGRQAAVALKTFTAAGNVVATNDEAELTAGHLTVALVPVRLDPAGAGGGAEPMAGRGPGAVWGGGDYEIESILAQQDVKLSRRDGGGATAQQAHISLTPEGTVARLLGQPATLGDGTNTLSGPHITFEQGPQRLAVQGPGALAFVARDAPEQAPRPVRLTWETGLRYDGAENWAEVNGAATVAAEAADGAHQVAGGDRIVIALADAPAAPAGDPADQAPLPKRAPVDYFGLASDKVLRTITLIGDAQVQSILRGQEEQEVRRVHLLAPQVKYDMEQRRAEVPSAGRMLVQDTLPQREEPTGNRLFGSFRGATAFQWAQSLVFDQAAGRMTMSGSVLIVHEDAQRAGPSFRLEAAEVAADLLQDRDHATPVADASATAAAGALFGPSELRLEALTASGDIRLSSPQIQLDAHQVEYDALKELLTARGSERVPVQLYREPGISRGSFQEVIWNVRTEQIHLREVQAQVRR